MWEVPQHYQRIFMFSFGNDGGGERNHTRFNTPKSDIIYCSIGDRLGSSGPCLNSRISPVALAFTHLTFKKVNLNPINCSPAEGEDEETATPPGLSPSMLFKRDGFQLRNPRYFQLAFVAILQLESQCFEVNQMRIIPCRKQQEIFSAPILG